MCFIICVILFSITVIFLGNTWEIRSINCARFKQKQRLGCIYDSEIQAYLGSGVKKIDLVFFILSPSLAFYLSSEKKLEHGRHRGIETPRSV